MTTRFDKKDRQDVEDAKTLFACILLLIFGILGSSIMIALADIWVPR